MLFKELAGVDAFPLCLNTTDVDEIVRIVEGVAPTFGGINLEDIAAPRCFEIERRLKESLDIPVFHDDQHGTAVVVLAALLNALRVVGKDAEDVRVVVVGAGAAGPGLREDHPRARRARPGRVRHRRHPAPGSRRISRGELAAMAARTNPRGLHGHRERRARGRRRGRRRVRPGRVHAPTPCARWPPTRSCSRWPTRRPRSSPRRSGSDVAIMATGPQRLPEPDQQRAGVPGHLPRRAGRPRARHRRGDEARRRARDRGRDPGVRPRARSTSSRASSTARSRPRWRTRWPRRRSSRGSPAASARRGRRRSRRVRLRR